MKFHQRVTVCNMSIIYHILKACDVIFHLRVLLRNMTLMSICLLSLTFQKNRSKNVVEYGSRRKSTLKKI